jgi:hypothetical protein
MKKSDITVEILKDIRQELRDLRADTNSRFEALESKLVGRIDETNARLDETNVRLDALGRRVVESELRVATAMTALARDVNDLTGYLRAQGDLRPRVERCERDIAEIQTKLRG